MKTRAKPVQDTKLLGCPFCGAPADIQPWHGGAPTKHRAGCSDEYCQVGPGVTGETYAEAMKVWNRRAP